MSDTDVATLKRRVAQLEAAVEEMRTNLRRAASDANQSILNMPHGPAKDAVKKIADRLRKAGRD